MMNSEKRNPHDDNAESLTDADFAADKMGRNSLQGDDQGHVHNQRHEQADTKAEADAVLDSFEKMDKDVRAEKDLNKGRRHSPKNHES